MRKDNLVDIASFFKVSDIILAIRKPVSRIVMYHGVAHETSLIITPENIHSSIFEKQLDFYTKKFEVVSLKEFQNRWRNNSLTNKEVVITLDDGYANNLYVAQPILKKYNCPYTVFISTNNIQLGDFFPTSIVRLMVYASNLKNINIPSIDETLYIDTDDDKKKASEILSHMVKTMPLENVKVLCEELIANISVKDWTYITEKYSSLRPMNWTEVERLAMDPLCTIGSHCKDHICCHYNQDNATLVDQITSSKTIIEEKLSTSCDYIAYPNGDFTPMVCNITRDAGYEMALTTQVKKRVSQSMNLMTVPRIGAPKSMNLFKIYFSVLPR